MTLAIYSTNLGVFAFLAANPLMEIPPGVSVYGLPTIMSPVVAQSISCYVEANRPRRSGRNTAFVPGISRNHGTNPIVFQ